MLKKVLVFTKYDQEVDKIIVPCVKPLKAGNISDETRMDEKGWVGENYYDKELRKATIKYGLEGVTFITYKEKKC